MARLALRSVALLAQKQAGLRVIAPGATGQLHWKDTGARLGASSRGGQERRRPLLEAARGMGLKFPLAAAPCHACARRELRNPLASSNKL